MSTELQRNSEVLMKSDNKITAVEAARRLNIGLDYLYGLLWTGKLRGTKVNGRWNVSEQAVEQRAQVMVSKGVGHGTIGR
jgi:excisionase family DNA binding protein